MKRNIFLSLAAGLAAKLAAGIAALTAALIFSTPANACTNVIVTPGASADGSAMVSYAADSHWLFGELYFLKGGRHPKGTMRSIIEWDTAKPLGQIPEAPLTYQRVGNMNVNQVAIGETTWGGRLELMDSTGIMDYGSLIYIALERARTAREAIDVIVSLANEYGYASEGESFSIIDKTEAWVMDLIGKGPDNRGIVWVARRIPDGYICGHANQARITRFPLDDPETLYAPDVISFAREKGYFTGADEDFSFREAYCPLDFGTVRGCDARVWSMFRILGGSEFDADAYLNYAMGYDLAGEMPLWIKPEHKITPKDVADVMRDHYEGTPMDMSIDIGAGGNALPYRWRPMGFKWNGKEYLNERAIATQQTGFWFVAQARPWLPDAAGALVWFGCDDAATSYLTPIYVSTTKVPECLREGNGDLLHYSATSQFWMCNRVTNACYKMYNYMAPGARCAADAFEQEQMFSVVPELDGKLAKVLGRGGLFGRIGKCKARRMMTKHTVRTAMKQFAAWTKLEELLLVKFIDGNVKAQGEDGEFLHTEYSEGIPSGLTQPGYTEFWKEGVANGPHGKVLEAR